jgi:hypothetical protein
MKLWVPGESSEAFRLKLRKRIGKKEAVKIEVRR